jgi:histidinol-phosphate aminotransferase
MEGTRQRMSMKNLAPENVRAIAPYVPGKPIAETARELGLQEADILKMASNENPLGSSPKAVAAIRGALDDLAYYPDGSGFDLKAVLSNKLGIGPAHLVLGNGSNDVLELSARAFLTRDASVAYSRHGFMVYPLVTQAIGARVIEVPTRGYETDLEAMRAAIRPDTRMVFVANPNNPTGTFTPWEELHAFIGRVPEDVLVVLDEAYGEYLAPELQSPAVQWITQFPNLILSRTLSKAYGLAGLRVGYGVADVEVAELMNRVRQPFNVNSIGLAAAAAALDDMEFVARSYAENLNGMRQLEEGARALGLAFIASYGNFLTIHVATGGKSAAEIFKRLLRRGVIVRPIAGYGLPEHLRVTIGTAAENEKFLAALAASIRE